MAFARFAHSYDRVRNQGARLVGWGAGSGLRLFGPRGVLRPEYVVDRDATLWGHRVHGVEIRPPEALAREDPRTTEVVVFASAFDQVARDVAALGSFRCLPPFADSQVVARSRIACRQRRTAASWPSGRERSAIVVQGPWHAAATPWVLGSWRRRYPSASLVLSTWKDTDPRALELAQSLADVVVLSELPLCAGAGNRNRQIVSTRAGIERARSLGATRILKTRTDLLLTGDDLLRRCDRLLRRYDASGPERLGLGSRVVVPQTFTFVHQLYHVSDLVMYGSARDLARLWAAPLDLRDFDPLRDPQWRRRSLAAFARDGGVPESYLAGALCRASDREMAGNFEDSWALYRDGFIVADDAFWGLLRSKRPWVLDPPALSRGCQRMDHGSWRRLYHGLRPLGPSGRPAFDPQQCTWGELQRCDW